MAGRADIFAYNRVQPRSHHRTGAADEPTASGSRRVGPVNKRR
jgi:hypothetical protein